jgi:predicted ATP-grasp superfamily ATP-dependent carboligase
MRLFLYEHLCASGITSASLRREGWAMLSALVDDFQQSADCEVWTLLDHLCPGPLGHHCHRLCEDVSSIEKFVPSTQRKQVSQRGRLLALRARCEQFRGLAAEADATLVIAPETGGVLAQLSRSVLETAGRWFGCSPSAIELCTDKKALAELWRQNGVPTPETVQTPEFPGFPVVLKPRDGAGSQATFLIRDGENWSTAWREARAEMPQGEFLVQRCIEGQPASSAFLMGPAGLTLPLLPATQRLSDDGRFHYLGGRIPLDPSLAERAMRLGKLAVGCIAGLQGYVGVDLILGAEESEDQAIEINPRLTTSYLGLRRLFEGNLAQTMWHVFEGKDVGELRWRSGTIRFDLESPPVWL